MTTPENPERLWIYTWADGFGPRTRAHETREASEGDRPQGYTVWITPTQAYVREDVAEEEMKSAVAVAEAAVLRVALCDIGRIRSCLVNRAAGLRRIGEEARALGVEDAIKQLEEEILG